jgi:hypothetical protein
VSGSNTLTWESASVIIGTLVLVTIVVVVVIHQGALSWRARVAAARDNEYRGLAARGTLVQEETANQLAQLQARMNSIESLLRTID